MLTPKILRKKSAIPAFLVLTVAVSPFLSAATGHFPLSQYKLKNGLQVLLSEDPTLPLVSVVIAYKAGSMDDPPGKTGLAYLMKNLMFAGSTNVPPGQHISSIHRVGGQFNATASEDRTVYSDTVPSYQLGLVLWLESDRMKFLDLEEAPFAKAQGDHLDDLDQLRKNEPFLESLWSFDQLAYADFAHGHPLWGSMDDVRKLTLDDAKTFYANYYAPNNAVLCVAGSFDPLKTKEWISRYFETIPRGKEIGTVSEPFAPAKKQVVRTFEDMTASAPAFYLGFRLGSPLSNDFPILRLIDYLLFRARTSPLSRRLIGLRSPLMTPVSGFIETRRDRSLYKIFATANTTQVAAQYQDVVFSELGKLKSKFLDDAEIGLFKTQFKQDYFRRITSAEDRALMLAEAYLGGGTVADLPFELDRFLNITAVDIVGIINRYFTVDNSIVLNIKPK